jgi:hypothetical protein
MTSPQSQAGYQAALDDIYRTFMTVKHLNKGRFDRDARQPQRLLGIARARGILPLPARTIKVSGSKGKGTTARIAARMLQNEIPAARIGLFVSPEEDDHYDRIRINGTPMTPELFVHHYGQLKPQLREAEADLRGAEYLSPLGIFLLIALDWFKAEGVTYFVLETGRGVAHDEVGQIRSEVGLLTSIMLEHADKLGPTLGDIAQDKLSLCDTSDHVIALSSIKEVAIQFSPHNLRKISWVESMLTSEPDLPSWLDRNAVLANAGISRLLACEWKSLFDAVRPNLSDLSASFGRQTLHHHTLTFEALIHTSSLDGTLLDAWQREPRPTHVIASFPDDKDREQLLHAFKARGWPVTECVLTGTRGYLDYARASADATASCVSFAFDDVAGFAAWLSARSASQAPGRTYLVGTQTYIRLVRKALAVLSQNGASHDRP